MVAGNGVSVVFDASLRARFCVVPISAKALRSLAGLPTDPRYRALGERGRRLLDDLDLGSPDLASAREHPRQLRVGLGPQDPGAVRSALDHVPFAQRPERG